MKTSLRARIAQRNVGDRRLSDLTLATAVTGLAATIGFGWLAAATYAGTASAPVVTSSGQDTVTIPRTGTGSNPATTNNGGSTTTRPKTSQNGGSSTNGGSSGTISRSNGRPHVSTGGS